MLFTGANRGRHVWEHHFKFHSFFPIVIGLTQITQFCIGCNCSSLSYCKTPAAGGCAPSSWCAIQTRRDIDSSSILKYRSRSYLLCLRINSCHFLFHRSAKTSPSFQNLKQDSSRMRRNVWLFDCDVILWQFHLVFKIVLLEVTWNLEDCSRSLVTSNRKRCDVFWRALRRNIR